MPSIRPHVERADGRGRKRLLISALISGLLLGGGHGAHADEADAFNFSVGANVTRDDNVFRLPPNSNINALIPGATSKADTLTTTYAGGKFKKTLGRQRLWLDVTFNQNRYDRFSFLDFDGHSGSGGFDWRLSSVLGGTVGKTRARQMAGFADLRMTLQNLYTNESEYANTDLWFAADWHFEAETRRTTLKYDSEINRTGDSVVDQWRAGLRYKPRDDSFILLRAIKSDGDLPNREVQSNIRVDNSYHQSEMGVEFSTTVTGQSRLRGLLAQTKREHRNVPERDFSGMTGNLGWDWALTGKTTLISQIRREIGASNDLLASYILTDGASITANWQPTAKIATSLRFDKYTRDYAGDPFIIARDLEKRKDTVNTLNLNVSYQPINSIVLSLNMARMERKSNFSGLAFKANTATLGAQFSF